MNTSRSIIHRIKRFTSSNLSKETSSILSLQISNQLKLNQNFPSSNLQLRYIFTEEFLGSSIVKLKQEHVKKELVKQNMDPANFQKQILSSIPNFRNPDESNSGWYSFIYIKTRDRIEILKLGRKSNILMQIMIFPNFHLIWML